MKKINLVILTFLLSFSLKAQQPYSVEYYYKVKWGYFDEFMDLYKKNHYPILKELKKQGEILDMKAVYPINHGPESGRWDFRFTIVFKDFAASRNQELSKSITLQLYPDQENFKKEEQHRFEILLEHIDVPIREENLGDWQ
jgi:glucan phosphorylase